MSGVCPMRVERFHGPVWGCWCGRDHRLAVPLGMAGVVWVCFWVPGPPPHSLGLWRGSDAHAWCAGDAFGGSRGRAWRVAV